MKTEEIEKAAEDYSKEYWREVSGMTNVEESIIYSMDNFKAGVEFSDKHWQEKTRWIPVEEKLPIPLPFEGVGEIANGDLLLLKHIGYGSIEFGVLRELNNKKYFELPDCGNCEINEISHWKEID